ncbi:MAG: hypothetical protein ACPL7D_04830, partial [Candidatus Sumerlaeaceae bacterium]
MKRKTVMIGAVMAIVALFAFGFFDRDQLLIWGQHFYLVGRHKVSKIGKSNPTGNLEHARICRENLERIQAAKRKIAEMRATTVGAVTWEEVLAVMYPDKARRGLT